MINSKRYQAEITDIDDESTFKEFIRLAYKLFPEMGEFTYEDYYDILRQDIEIKMQGGYLSLDAEVESREECIAGLSDEGGDVSDAK